MLKNQAMFHCDQCGESFEDPKRVPGETLYHFGIPVHEELFVCPACGCDELDGDYDFRYEDDEDEDFRFCDDEEEDGGCPVCGGETDREGGLCDLCEKDLCSRASDFLRSLYPAEREFLCKEWGWSF